VAAGERNDQLESLVRQAGCPYEALAVRLNQLGSDRGMVLTYGKSAICQWITKGTSPSYAVQELLAEVLGQKLRRLIRVEDLGMGTGTAGDAGLAYHESTETTLETAVMLWRNDVRRRDFVVKSPFVAASLAQPCRDWLLSRLDDSAAHDGDVRVSLCHVDALWDTCHVFAALDHQYGGGHARSSLIEFLNSDVARLLSGSFTERVGQALYGVTARLVNLAGWMAFDSGRDGLAQRYYTQALRLAEAAGSRVLGGHILADMSMQATHLGHAREGMQLARTGQESVRGPGADIVLARLHAMEARAHASISDGRACAAAMNRSERIIARADQADKPVWISFFGETQLAAEFGYCLRDLGQAQDARHLARQVVVHDDRMFRRRALTQTTVATTYLQQGEVEQAAVTGRDAAAAIAKIQSRRSVTIFRAFQQQLERHSHVPAVREFSVEANALIPAPV